MGEIQNGRNEWKNTTANHTLTMDRRRHAVITGVMDVSSFHETEIVLKVDGGMMVINGQNLHVGKLLLEEGRLDVEGRIDGVNYEAPKAVNRLFHFGKRT